jgi:hypothetical protein
VNAELDELEHGLAGAETLLKAGGRLAVVSFHSLEDRIVKQFLREASGAMARASRHLPQNPDASAPTFADVAKAVRPLPPKWRAIPARVRQRCACADPHRCPISRKDGSMNLTRDRVRSIGWAFVLTICFALDPGADVPRQRGEEPGAAGRAPDRGAAGRKSCSWKPNSRPAPTSSSCNRSTTWNSATRRQPPAVSSKASASLPRWASRARPMRPRRSAWRRWLTKSMTNAFPAMVSPLTGKAIAAEVPPMARARASADARRGLKDRLTRIDRREGQAQ